MDNNTYYETLKAEISRHLVDSNYSKATNYAAATRFERKYQLFLIPGFLITILGVSTLFSCVSKGVCIPCFFNMPGDCDIFSHMIAFLGVCITVWPLIKDYSGQAVMYRRFAEQYNEVSKRCINWETEYPSDSNIETAKMSVLAIRNSLSIINALSPNTKYKDYKSAKSSIEGGSYDYDNINNDPIS